MASKRIRRIHEPTMRQVQFGGALRDLRVAGNHGSQKAVATALGWDESKLNRIESGKLGISESGLDSLLNFYGDVPPPRRAYLFDLRKQGNQQGWESSIRDANPAYADLITLSTVASDLYNVECGVLPGLLQTPEYSASVVSHHLPDLTPEDHKLKVEIRAKRQEVFQRTNPLVFWGVISESALRHTIGGTRVMADQLDHLVNLKREFPGIINIQILPESAEIHAALFGPFVILTFPERWAPDVVYLEGSIDERFLEKEEEVTAYSRLFRRLMAAALPDLESAELIKTYRDTYRRE